MNELPADARAIAELRAAEDRDTLARLVKAGTVVHVGPKNAFSSDIDRRVAGQRAVNLAIRPKRKGKR